MAVLPELRARPAEARCRSGARPARRRPRRPRAAVRAAVTPAHAARVHRDAEQPDRTRRAARRADRVRAGPPGARPSRHRRGVLRLPRPRPAGSTRSRTSSAQGTTCSRCGRSRSSTGSRACGSGSASGRPRSSPRCGRCSAATTSGRSRRWPRSRASTTPTRSSGGARRTGRRSQSLTALLRAHGLEPRPGSATNFVLVDVGADANEAAAALLRAGVSVQSGVPFGAPTSLRIGAGSPADLALLDAALAAAGLG